MTPTTLTIVFTDVRDSTGRLMEAGGLVGAAEAARFLSGEMATADEFGATVVKALGDGIMAMFTSATAGVRAAIALQQRADLEARANDRDLFLRIGINVGDVILDDTGDQPDAFGIPVVVARRLCDSAAPGEILITDLVAQIVATSPAVEVGARRSMDLKGIPDPVLACPLVWTPLPERAPCRTVVAEDSTLVRAGIVALLREEGFDVVAEAGTLEELLAATRRHRPALVITDVRMPPNQHDEGIVAAAALRGEQPDLAILVVSQHVEPAAAALLLKHTPTAVGYLLKERISHIDEFLDACRTVAAGGVVIDPLVTERLLAGNDNDLRQLTDREREVLDMMAQGRSNAAIAREANCSPKTLESHVRSIFMKLGLIDDPDENRRVAAVIRYLHEPGART